MIVIDTITKNNREAHITGNLVVIKKVHFHQVAQSVNGQIHVIRQEGDGSVVSLHPQQVQLRQQEGQEEEDGSGAGAGEQVILDIPVDMLPVEMQPQNLPQPKSKPFKIYRCVIRMHLLQLKFKE